MKYLISICILTIISILPSYAQVPGSNVFDFNGIHDIYITFTQPNYLDSLIYYKEQGDITGDYKYMETTINFDGQIINSTGIRLKGNSSFAGSGIKKSIKLKFNKYVSGQKLDGMDKINLNNNFNDPTLMREKLFLDVLGETNVYAPRCVYSRVYINNNYWGLYTIVDQIEKTYLETNFVDNDGNLYKGDKNPWMTCANLSYSPDPMDYRDCYTLKTNESLNDWTGLENLIDIINNTPLPNYNNTLNAALDATSFINAWAANIVFVNVDSYVETGHNFYIYENPANGKFQWISWDVNESFGLWNIGMPLDQLYNLDIFYLPPNAQFDRPLSYYMLQDSTYRKMYTDKVFELVCEQLTIDHLYPKIDSLYNMIKPDVYADSNKIIGNMDFENNIDVDIYIPGYPGWVPGLKQFIAERRDTLISQLTALGYNMNNCYLLGVDEYIDDDISIYPNPTNNLLTIEFNNPSSSPFEIAIYDNLGRIVHGSNFIIDEKIEIDVRNFKNGIYHYTLFFPTKNLRSTGKFIKN